MKLKYLVSILHYLLSHYMITDCFIDYSGLLDHALNEGYVIVKWTKLTLCGPPGSGKSSVIKLLLNEPPPYTHDSTPVTTAPEVRKVDITSMTTLGDRSIQCWNKVDYESLKGMVAQTMKVGLKTRTMITEEEIEILEDDVDQDVNDEDIHVTSTVTTPTKESSQPNKTPLSSPSTQEVVQLLPIVQKSPALYETHWIYCVDSGGQAAFIDIAPALLHYNPVNILTLKLNEKLKDKPKFFFSVKGERIGQPVERQITHLQLLEASCRSLVSVNPPDLRNIYINLSHKEPHFIVLGTYLDKIDECSESLDDKNGILWSTLERFSEMIVSYRQSGEMMIFPINAIARGEEEIKMADLIRRKICQSYIEAEIPARWFLFQLDLDQLQKTSKTKIISKSECLRLGEALKMVPQDVEAALMYYHDLTIFLYFPQVLPHVVFLHPQPLFDKLSELISISFADAVDHLEVKGINIPPGAHKQLKTEGIFQRELLTSVLSQGFSPEFSSGDFLKLMENVFIIAALPQEGKYFIPCVLPTTTLSESLKCIFSKNTDPLVLTWGMCPLPQGLFPALVVNLLRLKCSIKFDLQPSIPSSNLQYRNAIRLTCTGLGGAVLLVDAIYWLEIYYSGPGEKCYIIRKSIKEGIDAVVKKFRFKPILSIPQENFHCTIHKTTDHLCCPNDTMKKVTCCDDGASVDDINPLRQGVWLKRTVCSEPILEQG